MPVYEVDDNRGTATEVSSVSAQPQEVEEAPIMFPAGVQQAPKIQQPARQNQENGSADYAKGYVKGYEDGLADGKKENQQADDTLLWKIVFCKEDKNNASTVVASAPTFDKCVEKFKKKLSGNTILSITMLDSII
jgi:flagellar biosynthesis/type III secretory pathway protein FliH